MTLAFGCTSYSKIDNYVGETSPRKGLLVGVLKGGKRPLREFILNWFGVYMLFLAACNYYNSFFL